MILYWWVFLFTQMSVVVEWNQFSPWASLDQIELESEGFKCFNSCVSFLLSENQTYCGLLPFYCGPFAHPHYNLGVLKVRRNRLFLRQGIHRIWIHYLLPTGEITIMSANMANHKSHSLLLNFSLDF